MNKFWKFKEWAIKKKEKIFSSNFEKKKEFFRVINLKIKNINFHYDKMKKNSFIYIYLKMERFNL